MENKETFQARIKPYFSPFEQLDIKLAYVLAKFGHRAQRRKEMIDDVPVRYFEHVRRVSLILMDEVKIMDRDMVIAALLHDSIEDTDDLTPELIEHSFGTNVVNLVKILSKDPKEGYHERLSNCKNWKALTLKACDRLDNLRSLMVPGTTLEFHKRQIEETEKYYFPLFDELLRLCPSKYVANLSPIRDEIRGLIVKYKTIIEFQQGI